MSWAIGYDSHWRRDVGYGVPATCDSPDCAEEIDRGLGYICGGDVGGGEHGCGLFFCGKHLVGAAPLCDRCDERLPPFSAKPDVTAWIQHKLTDESWQVWRERSPVEVAELQQILDQRRQV